MNNNDLYTITKLHAKGITLGPDFEDYVREKLDSLEKLLDHFSYDDHELIFEVELEKTTNHHQTGEIFRAEINFSAGSKLLRGEATGDDMYAAIDEARDGLRRQMTDDIDKGRHHFR